MSSPVARRKDEMTPGGIARVHHYFLDDSWPLSPIEAEFAETVRIVAPHVRHLARVQRALLGRMVRYLVGEGIRQFLDLGSGLPAADHVHEVAQAVDPECRVVYVDNEPSIVKEGKALLAGNDRVGYVHADLRCPNDVIAAEDTRRIIDFEQPLAVFLVEALLHVPDADRPDLIVSGYVDAISPGSFLGISQFGDSDALEQGFTSADRMFGAARPPVFLRHPEWLADFFSGLELVDGIKPVQLWRPDPTDVPDRNPELGRVYAGLGRKPQACGG